MPELYPLNCLIEEMRILPVARVVADDFDDGTVTTRRGWPSKYFKRKLRLLHAALAQSEMELLLNFYHARNGRVETFWFRDNVTRTGNILCRFASELAPRREGSVYIVEVDLEEAEPIRAFPSVEEVTTAGGTAPVLWLDANREIYLTGTSGTPSEANLFEVNRAYTVSWMNGAGGWDAIQAAQYQWYGFNGGSAARSSANISQFSTAQPACTLFAFLKAPTVASRAVLMSLGPLSSGAALGIEISSGNYIQPFLGGAESWATARFLNSPISTWRSVAITWAASSNTAKLYVNAALIGSEANTRSYTAGKFNFGQAPDGTLVMPTPAGANHPLVFNAELTLAQVKAVHNLLCYQYGVATVS